MSVHSSDDNNSEVSGSSTTSSIMPPTAKNKTTATKRGPTGGAKTTGLEDSPPPKKAKVADPPKPYNINVANPWTFNHYGGNKHDTIDLVLHQAGVPDEKAQPDVTLSSDGYSVAVGWKTPSALLSDKQAKAQKIPHNTTQYQGYNNTMQQMYRDGVRAMQGYYIGSPQVIHLHEKCVEVTEINRHVYLAGYWVYNGVQHKQFSSTYVVKLHVHNIRVGLAGQVREGGMVCVNLFSQDSTGSEGLGGVNGGGGGGVGSGGCKRGGMNGGGGVAHSKTVREDSDY